MRVRVRVGYLRRVALWHALGEADEDEVVGGVVGQPDDLAHLAVLEIREVVDADRLVRVRGRDRVSAHSKAEA